MSEAEKDRVETKRHDTETKQSEILSKPEFSQSEKVEDQCPRVFVYIASDFLPLTSSLASNVNAVFEEDTHPLGYRGTSRYE